MDGVWKILRGDLVKSFNLEFGDVTLICFLLQVNTLNTLNGGLKR